MSSDRTPSGSPQFHGPAEVRAALVPHATEATLALYDGQLEEICLESTELGSPQPLAKFLAYWWDCADIAANGRPAGRPSGGDRAKFIADWEARNGRPFPAPAHPASQVSGLANTGTGREAESPDGLWRGGPGRPCR
jgi:hypothetical protein